MSTILRTGQELAGYRVDERLASGGMGVVYRATQLSLGRTVALKVLAPHLSADPEFAERFRQEAAVQARLEHPNILTVYEAGESDEGLFLAMGFVEGTDLKRLIAAGDLNPERALRLLEQVAAALDAAHDAGLVHRDVKPQNVLVDGGDRAYLADFGLTKRSGSRGITRTGAYLGSLDYVSPEQVRGDEVTAASDRYAFAAVLYECLSGQVPFPRDTEAALLYAHVSEPPPRVSDRRPELPQLLDDLLARGLAKEPAARFPTATQLVRDAQAALDLRAGGMGAGDAAERDRARFGETIVDPGLLRRAPRITVEPERGLPRAALLAAIGLLCIGLAAAGFLLGHGWSRVEDPPPGFAVAGPLSLTFPTPDWEAGPPSTKLQSAVALSGRRRARGGSLVAGIAASVEPRTFLPRGTAHGKGEAVYLGRYQALRYRGTKRTTYALPIGRGAALIRCSGDAAARRRCESVATTIALHGVEAGRIGPDPRFAASLGGAVARFDAVRAAERRALAAAKSPDARAGHADVLASAYATAAGQLDSVAAGPRERTIQRRLVRALARARDAYVLLGAALRVRNRDEYRSAANRIRAAEAAANAALRALTRLGYSTRS